MEALPLGDALQQILDAGYDGVETSVPTLKEARRLGFDTPALAMLFTEDVETLRAGLAEAREVGAEAVNVHAGKDWFTFQQGCMFFEGALEAVEESGLTVTFETHRARLLFDPVSTAAYLRKFQNLRITADFSHWTCVCGSLLHDQEESVELAIQHTSLIHARVGHTEGPQVPDPRVPQWQEPVDRFLGFWDRIKAAHEARGEAVLRVDPEFGPPNYMWTDPATGQPLADLWDVCKWMRDTLRERWA
jgi:sugar phosphate isomerase/epimerase